MLRLSRENTISTSSQIGISTRFSIHTNQHNYCHSAALDKPTNHYGDGRSLGQCDQ